MWGKRGGGEGGRGGGGVGVGEVSLKGEFLQSSGNLLIAMRLFE